MTEALLVMDYQLGIVERFSERGLRALERVNTAIASARARGVMVIFIRVAFRPGAPEVSSRNVGFYALTRTPGWEESASSTSLHPQLDIGGSDVVVVKRRVSAFVGSDLEVVLRGAGITHLALAGISTSGVVLSTVRAAADMDFVITVLHDACVDADEDVHRTLMEKVFPRQATVTTVDDWRSLTRE